MSHGNLGFFGVAGTVAALLVASASPARADRWWGSEICMNLDSVHIMTDTVANERLVTFQMRLCDGGEPQWWAVISEACHRQPRHIVGFDLRQWQDDNRIWMPPMFAPDDDSREVVNAGVACNWAYPSLFGQ